MNTAIDTGTNELLCNIRDRVAIITLNRPDARNSLSDDLTPALRTMIKTCGENPQVGAMIITGAGKAFSGGADIKEFGTPKALQEPNLLSVILALEASTKPIVTALHGGAYGGGLELAMSCHYRVAHRATSNNWSIQVELTRLRPKWNQLWWSQDERFVRSAHS